PQSGQVLLGGVDLRQLDLAQLRRRVAVVSQDIVLFRGSLADNLAYSVPDASREAVAEVARKHDLWVISDEVYGQLTYDREHLSIASLPGMAERTVILNSLSKTHAMTGWRVGWVIAPPALVG
ncbi:aminotransferase class I/II-fold pyridoxal phosphate-dependent enzyme, partial [Pseudomonas sp. SIMBA_077]